MAQAFVTHGSATNPSSKLPGLQLDANTLHKLKEQALRKVKMLQAKACTCTFLDLCMPLQASANVLAIAENFYYLTKTSHIMQAARATSENLDKAKVAVHDVASSRNAHEASSRMWTLWRHAERGTFMTALGRMLVRIYTMISPLLLLHCSTHQLSPDQWSLNDWQALEHNSISAPARHVS